MKKSLYLIGLLSLGLACKSVEQVVPKTKLDNSVRLPGRVITTSAKLKVLEQLVAAGVLTNAEDLKVAIKELRKFDGGFIARLAERKLVISKMSYESPKDVSADKLVTTYDPESGSFKFDVDQLKSSTNPEIIITTGDAQYKITTAEGDAFAKGTDALTGLVSQLNPSTAAVATGVKALKGPKEITDAEEKILAPVVKPE